jgi:glycine cleavage system pyridoxal-binding protein P
VEKLVVSDEDFELAKCVTEVMMDSMISVVDDMLDKMGGQSNNKDLYNILPTDVEIRANEIIAKGKELLGMSERTARRRLESYIKNEDLKFINRGVYMKPSA